jgi:hypothetical protein
MPMTRKDYIVISDILNLFVDRLDSIDFNDLIFEFSEMFLEDNPRFDEEKFQEACYKVRSKV